MGLSRDQIDDHIAQWEKSLGESYRSYRDKWPSRLFHHTPLENAVNILQAGLLRSRNDVRALGARDIASQEVVNSRRDAHKFVRLYFRPRTPTQFHIEGVRKDAECYNNEVSAHAPVLTMFVFAARSVLALKGCQFSTGNMQSPGVSYGPNIAAFRSIDFAKVYHEGGISGDYSIISARCAEVLAPSPLPLAGNLQFVLCRSQAERQTLLHSLGGRAHVWADLIRVSDDMQVFQKEYCYVEEVSLSSRGVTFRLHPRLQPAKVSVQVRATKGRSERVAVEFGPEGLDPIPGGGKTRWITESETPLEPGDYHVSIWLEGHLAFDAVLPLQAKPF